MQVIAEYKTGPDAQDIAKRLGLTKQQLSAHLHARTKKEWNKALVWKQTKKVRDTKQAFLNAPDSARKTEYNRAKNALRQTRQRLKLPIEPIYATPAPRYQLHTKRSVIKRRALRAARDAILAPSRTRRAHEVVDILAPHQKVDKLAGASTK